MSIGLIRMGFALAHTLCVCVSRCRGGVCGVLNPTNPNLYDVLENVYRDLVDMFPSDTVHLGR